MMFWKRWQEKCTRYQLLAEQHKNDYILQYGPLGNAQCSYDFYRLIGDGDPDFPLMAMSIMKEILAPFKIATYVRTWDFRLSKKQKTPNPQDYFPAKYHRSLVACDNAQNAYYNQAMELITLSDGIDFPLMDALLDRGKREIWSNKVCQYAYLNYPFVGANFESIKAALAQDACNICVVYEEQHDLLKMIVSHASPLAEESIVAVVQGICSRYDKHLEVI